jgi:hypothetical protein
MLTSCLVTDPIEFKEEKSFPPFFVNIPGSNTPIGSMIAINLDDLAKAGSGPQEVRLKVQVRDENVPEVLQTRYKLTTVSVIDSTTENAINSQDTKFRVFSRELAPSGIPLRPYELAIETSLLSPGQCYALDLVVTGSFTQDLMTKWKDPEVEGDVAEAMWLLAVRESAEDEINIDTCPQNVYQIEKQTTSENDTK